MDEKITSIIEKHTGEGILFVLKGFPMASVNIPESNLHETIKNKLARLMQITQQTHQIIAFDEFICLYDLIVLQYKKIYIIENSVFWNMYPTGAVINEKISKKLLAHFDPDANEEIEIGEIGEYTQVYSNYLLTDQGIACCYNVSDSLLKLEKIERIAVGSSAAPLSHIAEKDDEKKYLNLCNDADYFQLVMELLNNGTRFAVTWESYAAGKEIAQKHLELLNGFFPGRIYAYLAPSTSKASPHNPEIAAILKKYWRYHVFRNIKMYDLNEVEKGNKKVIEISQEQIISDMVEQVENCVSGKSFKDLFVTAPTGAGKSLMFQIPAIYLAEKYNLVTLVITPLIGLMNDQVQALTKRGYAGVRTINSDICETV